jgi:hypothetical protein
MFVKSLAAGTYTLVAGAYKAYCAPHESIMFQHFSAR